MSQCINMAFCLPLSFEEPTLLLEHNIGSLIHFRNFMEEEEGLAKALFLVFSF